jgi:O-antigen/teichoic acid export membrane protein
MEKTTHAENNKRIAKNTLALYFRQIITMFISLFTSRIILQTLGVTDYGINNVVGGVVAMLSNRLFVRDDATIS